MQPKILKLILTLSLLSVLNLYGCAVAIVGIGAAGAGAAAYFNGKLTKTYESEYHQTVQASSTTLEELKIPKTETIADELKTEIHAERPDGTPVVIEILRIEAGLTDKRIGNGPGQALLQRQPAAARDGNHVVANELARLVTHAGEQSLIELQLHMPVVLRDVGE